MTNEDHAGSAIADNGDEQAYFERRAEWHRGRASVAPDDSTRTLHERFARLYRDRAGSF